jgi:hypothetical protein
MSSAGNGKADCGHQSYRDALHGYSRHKGRKRKVALHRQTNKPSKVEQSKVGVGDSLRLSLQTEATHSNETNVGYPALRSRGCRLSGLRNRALAWNVPFWDFPQASAMLCS